MELSDVVRKLIGKIDPIGDSNVDSERLNNLMELTKLVDVLLSDIDRVASFKNKVEWSMKQCGEHADKFLNDIGIS